VLLAPVFKETIGGVGQNIGDSRSGRLRELLMGISRAIVRAEYWQYGSFESWQWPENFKICVQTKWCARSVAAALIAVYSSVIFDRPTAPPKERNSIVSAFLIIRS